MKGPNNPTESDRYFAKLVDLCVNTPNALLVSYMAGFSFAIGPLWGSGLPGVCQRYWFSINLIIWIEWKAAYEAMANILRRIDFPTVH